MRGVKALAVGALALSLAGCGGMKYQSDYDPSADFASLRTYQWVEKVPDEARNPKVYNAIIEGRVKTAVNRALQGKGFQEVNSNPDFHIAWHASVEQKQSLQTVGNNYGWGYGWYGPGWGGMGTTTSTTYVNEWDEGTFVVGIFNPETDDIDLVGLRAGRTGRGQPPTGQGAGGRRQGRNQALRDVSPGFIGKLGSAAASQEASLET